MALIVQKFGGSSVKDRDRIFNVARIVANTHNAGNDVVVVVSAVVSLVVVVVVTSFASSTVKLTEITSPAAGISQPVGLISSLLQVKLQSSSLSAACIEAGVNVVYS